MSASALPAIARCPLAATAWIAAACVAGVGLRLFNLRDQVLGGDELHAVATALGRPLGWILTHYARADHSIPLAASFRLWLEAGGRLEEFGLRVPGLACGALLLPLVAWATLRATDAPTAVRATWLVAISPSLVLYSRIVRSYAPMVLLAIAAAVAAYAWLTSGSRRARAAYVACAALATWLHLGAAPFVLAPLLFGVAWRMRSAPGPSGAGPPSWRALAATSVALALAFAAFLLPARDSLLDLWGGVRQTRWPGVATWLAVAKLQAGARDGALAGLAFALAGLGVARLARTRPRLAAYGAVLVVAQILGLLLLRPAYFHQGFILNRYLLPVLVVVQMWIAVGLGALAPRRSALACLAAFAFVLALFARGPLAAASYVRGSFAHHNDLVSFDAPRLGVDPAQQPRLHASLAREGAPAVIEIPWHPWWTFSRLAAADQFLHGGRVLVSGRVAELADPRVTFRNFVPLEPGALERSGARWVVVHLDLEAEQARLLETPDDALDEVPADLRDRVWSGLRRVAADTAQRLEAVWGPPDHAEPGIRAWRLPRSARP